MAAEEEIRGGALGGADEGEEEDAEGEGHAGDRSGGGGVGEVAGASRKERARTRGTKEARRSRWTREDRRPGEALREHIAVCTISHEWSTRGASRKGSKRERSSGGTANV